MPPPDDPWTRPSGPAGGTGPGSHGSGGRAWPIVVGLVSALVLTGVVATVVILVARPTRTTTATPPASSSAASTRPAPAPGSASPVASDPASPTPAVTPASASPTAAPGEPLPTGSGAPTSAPQAGPDRSLRTNSLYGVDLGRAAVSCDLPVRRPKPPLADKKLQGYLSDVVACLTRTFKAPLAAHGFPLVAPKVRTYHRKVESPCGDFDQQGSPAYYCSSTTTIYWPDTVDDGREAYTFARLGYVGLIAHEFGHHLQFTTGMLWDYSRAYQKASTKEQYALSRRLELQAQCFEGVFLHANAKALDVGAKDRSELRTWHGYTGDEDPPEGRKPDHGSSKAQYAWLRRGLDSGDFASCNTWTANAKSVS